MKISRLLVLVVVAVVGGGVGFLLSQFNQNSGHSSHGSSAKYTAEELQRDELARESDIVLDATGGREIGFVYEAFLSPQQEGGEERDTPSFIPSQFQSTGVAVDREDRPSRGHGVVEFTKDLSRAYVHLAIEGVDVADVNLLHLHCGRPGQLGPIIIDFGLMGNLQEILADGVMRFEVTNKDIEAVANSASSLVDAFTHGCPILLALPMDKVKTIAGMEYIAREGDLYFNLHTKSQTYFGDIRGQLHHVEDRR